MPGRTVVIGDVHGCIDELDALLGPAGVGVVASDTVIFVGDLVDKGPAPAAAVARARGLAMEALCEVVLVEGNHEERFRRWRRHAGVEEAGGRPNPMADADAGGELTALAGGLSAEDHEFLEAGVLWHPIDAELTGGAGPGLVLHGGLPPNLGPLPTREEFDALSNRRKRRWRQVQRTRFVDPETGGMVPLGEEQRGHVFWAELYDGRLGPIWFGHHAFTGQIEPVSFPHATGLDLGCVHGGRLAAAILTPGEAPSSVTVPAGKEYSPPLELAQLRALPEDR